MYIHIVYVCTCKRNYTYRNTDTYTRKASHGRTCLSYWQQARPIGQRTGRTDGWTDERTDAHIPVIVLSQEEAGTALSASLALDSYRKMFPTRSTSLVHHISSFSPVLSLSLSYSSMCCLQNVASHSVCSSR